MTFPDLDAIDRLVRKVAAEELLPRFRNLAETEIREKAVGDLVTVADEACERRLSTELAARLHGSVVVGEEAVTADRAVLDRLSGDAPVWVIDPLDGTSNFARGVDQFCVIVALVHRGVTQAGLIHDPVRDRTAVALAGGGAWMDGRRLTVTLGGSLLDFHGAYTIPKEPGPRRDALLMLRRMLGSHGPITCAGLEYLEGADGGRRITVFNRLNPWDHAAGVLLHVEAGGKAALIDGRPYAPTLDMGPMLVAPDDATWDAALAALGGFRG